ncbi:MAG TPA: ABC transporter permease [Anaerolineae bacterium]|nr:ABC transporter permease [Anaerolineae bacterium]
MSEILRNMGRRKLRTGLTVMGIVIGILALTVMGSMTEYFAGLLDNAEKLVGTNIIITPKSDDFTSVLSVGDQRRIERTPGVQQAIPLVNDTLEELSGVSFGGFDSVLAVPPEQSTLVFPSATLKKGRWLERGDDYAAVIGIKLAEKKNLDLGGELTYRDKKFTVVGILNETHTTPDNAAVMPLDTVRRAMKSPDLVVAYYVVPQDPAQADRVALELKNALGDVNVQTPKQAIDQARQALAIFNVILVSGAVLAVFVGGLAVINTMIMSVNERRHEIGLKKAIGASDGEIIFEYLLEAAAIGLLGGLLGLALGWGVATLLNAAASSALGGTNIFLVTPRLAAIALGFAIGLGMIAGLYPAWNAARLDPVKALRVDS